MDRIETMLKVPDYITPSWIRIDPALASLRRSTRYRQVIGVLPAPERRPI